MQIPDKYLQEFKNIYKKEFGEEIDEKEALDCFTSLINIVRMFRECIPLTLADIEAMPDDEVIPQASSRGAQKDQSQEPYRAVTA